MNTWEECFVAALTGSARDPFPPEKDEEDVIHRAYRIADAAFRSIEARRAYIERQALEVHRQVEDRAPFGVKAIGKRR